MGKIIEVTNAVRYTEDVPTREGWYWYKNGEVEVVVALDEPLRKLAVDQRRKNELARKPGPYWAGPLQKPLPPVEMGGVQR